MSVFPVAVSLLSSGCLVTEDILFEGQEDVPPTFVFRPRSRSMPQIGETLTVDSDALLADGITNLTFKLQVRDDNVLQPLETQIRLRTLEGPAELLVIDEDGVTIPGTGSAVRDYEFSFGTTLLKDGHCHQLQLAVSGEFQVLPDGIRVFALAENPEDVAIATWWLWETSADTVPPVNLETCPTDDF